MFSFPLLQDRGYGNPECAPQVNFINDLPHLDYSMGGFITKLLIKAKVGDIHRLREIIVVEIETGGVHCRKRLNSSITVPNGGLIAVKGSPAPGSSKCNKGKASAYLIASHSQGKR